MEENIKKVLEHINNSLLGVSLEFEGERLRLSYNDESKNYSMATRNKFQSITLDELLVILNRPELQEAVEQEAKRIEAEEQRSADLKTKYFEEIDTLDIPEEEKNRLRAMVKQVVLPSSKVGMGNRVPVIDPELEARRKDCEEHREEYEKKRNALFGEIDSLSKKMEGLPEDKAKEIQETIDTKWEELNSIPAFPNILGQHFRLNDEGNIMLVTALDGNVTIHDYKPMSIQEAAEFSRGKELKINHELIQSFDEPEK